MHFRSKQRRRAGPEARRQPAAHPLWSDNFHPRPLTSSLGLPPQSPPPSFSPSSSCRLTICLRSASERRAVLFQFSSRAPPPSSLSPRLPKRQNSLCLRGGDGRRKERDADVGSCVIPSPELCIFLFRYGRLSPSRRRRRRCQCGSTSGGDGRTGKGSAGGSRLHGSRRREFIENENEERRVNGGTTATTEGSSGNGSPPRRRCRQRLQAAAESYAAHFA